jgi:hypothetical protein
MLTLPSIMFGSLSNVRTAVASWRWNSQSRFLNVIVHPAHAQ